MQRWTRQALNSEQRLGPQRIRWERQATPGEQRLCGSRAGCTLMGLAELVLC